MLKFASKWTVMHLVFLHLFLGVLIYAFPFFSKIYAVLILFFGLGYIVKTQNKNSEALLVSAYIVGAEVLLRMTNGGFISEFGKYTVMICMFLGILYSGFSKTSFIYVLLGIVLLPGVFIGVYAMNFETDIRKAIAFNISGEACLIMCAIYCFQRKLDLNQIKLLFYAFALPISIIVTYLFLYTPNLKEVINSTGSNFATSGGFGPNQVSTVLGFGTFVFFTLFYLFSKDKKDKIMFLALVFLCSFRGLLTMSRGGMMVGGVMIAILICISFLYVDANNKKKIFVFLGFGFFACMGLWSYTSYQSNGMLNKRYSNQDARGRLKESKLSGRENLIESELQMFMDHPIVGVGVGKNKEYRQEELGIVAASHNEMTRLLAEHGSLGIIALLILLTVPIFHYFDNKQHIFLFCFYVFWLLTINHASMRLAAPGFVYALSLLQLNFKVKDENHLHRE